MRQVLAVLFALFSCLATPSFAAKLVTDLSKDQIAIEANFTGDKILLFGAIDNAVQNAQVDVIVVVRGPAINALLRKKEYQAGIWLNGSEMTFGAMPSFYSIASNRPLDEIAPSKTLALHELGMQELKHFPTETAFTQDELAEFAAAHIRLKKEQGLYRDDDTGVQIISGRLFRSEITIPTQVPLGEYKIDFFLFENGRLTATQTSTLAVDFYGIESTLHMLAHDMPLLYGLTGVFLAMFMGWGVATLFRRI
jgi:uncharacterized protein (TIGR02186 family)